MLSRLHTVYKIIHCAALHTLCDITVYIYSKVAIFRVQSGKNYTGQKIFTQTPSVVSVTNIRYDVSQLRFDNMCPSKDLIICVPVEI